MVGFLAGASALTSIAGGLSGLFSSNKGAPSARENTVKLAQGARQAAERYGFNPLTMLQHGAAMGGGGGGGSAPPLASIELITGGLRDLNDVASGDAARRRAADELELDLAKVRLDQARSGVNTAPATFGRRAVTQPANGGAVFTQPLAMRTGAASPALSIGPSRVENVIAPGRPKEIDPVINSPGVFEIDNRVTGGPITIPGEGEPWGIDEAATALLIGGPQAGLNWGRATVAETKKWPEMTAEEKEKSSTAKVNKNLRKHPPGTAGLWSRAIDLWN